MSANPFSLSIWVFLHTAMIRCIIKRYIHRWGMSPIHNAYWKRGRTNVFTSAIVPLYRTRVGISLVVIGVLRPGRMRVVLVGRRGLLVAPGRLVGLLVLLVVTLCRGRRRLVVGVAGSSGRAGRVHVTFLLLHVGGGTEKTEKFRRRLDFWGQSYNDCLDLLDHIYINMNNKMISEGLFPLSRHLR